MPIYEYTCRKCGSQFELLIRGGDVPACPSCRSQQVAKELSVPAAHAAASQSLPVCQTPASGGCGLPQCGSGRCAWD
ncbi:MAG: zinc ribbon domain-containing protein [Pirellulaceae bacterium]|nr:zinc ribbon domain-containing protein [Pirellulaceae bacterium]